MASGGPKDPGSWNRYAYTRGDPINRVDRRGLEDEYPTYCDVYPDDPICSPYPIASNPGCTFTDGCEPQQNPVGNRPIDPREVVSNAVGNAGDRLNRPDCAGLFLDPDSNTPEARKALSDKLDSLFSWDNKDSTIRIQPGTNPDDPNVAAFTTDTLGLIYVYGGGAFFTNKLANGQSIGSTSTYGGMTSWDFQALVIIHEFVHYMGIVGPDGGPAKDVTWTLPNGDKVTGSDQLSKEIRKKCF